MSERAEGYYWVKNLTHGSVYPLLYQDGRWHDDVGQTQDDNFVLEGPLRLPTEVEIAGQAEHFESCRRQKELELGGDPVWDGWLDGFYWLRFDDEEPEIAAVMEGSWRSLTWDPYIAWGSEDLEGPPPVLFGPLIVPAPRTGSPA